MRFLSIRSSTGGSFSIVPSYSLPVRSVISRTRATLYVDCSSLRRSRVIQERRTATLTDGDPSLDMQSRFYNLTFWIELRICTEMRREQETRGITAQKRSIRSRPYFTSGHRYRLQGTTERYSREGGSLIRVSLSKSALENELKLQRKIIGDGDLLFN